MLNFSQFLETIRSLDLSSTQSVGLTILVISLIIVQLSIKKQ